MTIKKKELPKPSSGVILEVFLDFIKPTKKEMAEFEQHLRAKRK